MKKIALITGASSGIGRQMAHIHARTGGDVIAVARSTEKLAELKSELEREYQISVTIISKDLSLPEAPQEIYDEVKSLGIEIDYLINNAGFGGLGLFHERDWDRDLSMIQVNITALTELTRLFLPSLVQKGEGKILNVSSTASLIPGPRQAVYYATKAYVTSFSNAIAQELAGTGVTVTALLPGATGTAFAKSSGMDKTSLFDKTADPKDVAQDGYDAMLAGKLDVISGITFSQKILFLLMPFMSKKFLLKQIDSWQRETK